MIHKTHAWHDLEKQAKKLKKQTIAELCHDDENRFQHFSCQAADWLLDYSRNLVTQETMQALTALAEEAQLKKHIDAMFAGDIVNNTEQRAVLHTALRDPNGKHHDEINAVLEQIEHFSGLIHNKRWQTATGDPITDVVILGIGGSRLGPELVIEALKHYGRHGIRCHFVSNIAPSDFSLKLKNLNPSSILFIVSSKTFTTSETMTNAIMAKQWLSDMLGNPNCIKQHFVAVTAAPTTAVEFGIAADNIFPFWDWVGGRYSLWSAIGLPIALSLGFKKFKALLNGAHAMDQHFLNTPFSENMPVILALLGIWQRNFLNVESHAVIPYCCYLEKLPGFLQQLDMESNGKRVDRDGEPLTYNTGPIIWGGVGTDCQHSFHQWLHQSATHASIDFIAFKHSLNPTHNQQAMLFANCIAQAEALMQGRPEQEAGSPHKMMPGNRSSNLLLCDTLTPETLGALLALYEHKVFAQGVIWNINSFDQFGVELGKKMATTLLNDIESTEPSTIGAINWFKEKS